MINQLRSTNRKGNDYWVSLLCTAWMLALFWVAYRCEWGRMYSRAPYHRLQVEALLNGRFSLSSSIENIEHDLAWYNGQVNQVWGLGIAIWMLPFELFYRCCGGTCCPDRIPLIAAIALFAWYTSRGGIAVSRTFRSKILGALFAYIILLFPSLWTLILGYNQIYSTTVLYALIVSISLLVGLVRVYLLGKTIDFFIVCALASLSSLVRATHGIYGLLAALLCGLVHLYGRTSFDRIKVIQTILGWGLVLSGFVFLAYSNYVRFGSPTEFGHRLTVSSDMIIYVSRFGNPFAALGFLDASKELLSWVFLSPFHQDTDWYFPHVVPWQTSAARWRDVNYPTFDPSCFVVLLLGFSIALVFLCRRMKRSGWSGLFRNKMVARLILGLVTWFGGCALALARFYLYSPAISSRYILDFAPSFLAMFVAVLLLVFRRYPRLTMTLTALCLGEGLVLLVINPEVGSVRKQDPLSFAELSGLHIAKGERLSSFNGRYSIVEHPTKTDIIYNGAGWYTNGQAESIVILMVDRPRFLEVSMAEHQQGIQRREASGVYRAKIDNIELPVESLTHSVTGTNELLKVKFEIPHNIVQEDGNQLVCLCFTRSLEKADLASLRQLFEVRWR